MKTSPNYPDRGRTCWPLSCATSPCLYLYYVHNTLNQYYRYYMISSTQNTYKNRFQDYEIRSSPSKSSRGICVGKLHLLYKLAVSELVQSDFKAIKETNAAKRADVQKSSNYASGLTTLIQRRSCQFLTLPSLTYSFRPRTERGTQSTRRQRHCVGYMICLTDTHRLSAEACHRLCPWPELMLHFRHNSISNYLLNTILYSYVDNICKLENVIN
jgi:hypothetical protein